MSFAGDERAGVIDRRGEVTRSTCSRSTSRIFGTDTSTEIRRVLICATISTGL